jgi:hypothetical protein
MAALALYPALLWQAARNAARHVLHLLPKEGDR